MFLSHSTWSEVREYCKGSDIVVIPTGSCEQHGLHLPLGTDYLVVEEIANRINKKAEVLICPTLPLGHSSNHDSFPGTISIAPQTYRIFMGDVCEGLYRQGLKKMLFLNGHSGNTPLLQEVCNIIRDKRGFGCIVDWWDLVGMLLPEDTLSGHGDALEASAVLAFHPKLVKMGASQPYKPKYLTERIEVESWQKLKFRSAKILTWVKSQDGSDTGNFGSLKESTAERGERALSAVTEYVLDLIEEMRKIDLRKLT